jgi:hypothetical protein
VLIGEFVAGGSVEALDLDRLASDIRITNRVGLADRTEMGTGAIVILEARTVTAADEVTVIEDQRDVVPIISIGK